MKVKLILKNFFKSFSIFILCVSIVISGATPSFAKVKLPDGRDNEFAENNIVFYNPAGKPKKRSCNTIVGDCKIYGDTKDEKLWSGLRSQGFSPEQTAALMGNFAHEGGSPTRQEDAYIIARNKNCKTKEGNAYTIHTYSNEHHDECMEKIYSKYSNGKAVAGIGLGFVQWTSKDRREGYLAKMDALGLKDTYFEGDAYKEWGSLSDDQLKSKIVSTTGSDADYWNLWCAAIKYIREELDSPSYSAFFNKTTVEDMAGYISATYEKCSGCKPGDSSYNERVRSAKEYYEDFLNGKFDTVEKGTASSASVDSETEKNTESTPTNTSSTETGKNVFIIGDSITARSESEIKALLPDVSIDAEVSRSWETGLSILKGTSDKRKILVFALGSNNTGGVNADSMKQVINAAGSETSVIFVTNYSLSKHTTAYNNTNAAMKSSGAIIADWAVAVASDPTKYVADEGSVDVHPTIPDGTKLFAKVIYEAVTNGTLHKQNDSICSNEGGETTYEEIGDYTYAFPLKGAKKSNYLNPGGKAGWSELSRIPCGSGSCHHDYNAVDMGLRASMAGYTEVKASDHPGSGFDDKYYFSVGVKVVAIVGGKIKTAKQYTNKVPSAYHDVCGQITLQGEDGKTYWMGHLAYPLNVKAGDTVTAGQVIAEVGLPQCAQNTQSHLHIDNTPNHEHYVIDLMDKLWESLPE